MTPFDDLAMLVTPYALFALMVVWVIAAFALQAFALWVAKAGIALFLCVLAEAKSETTIRWMMWPLPVRFVARWMYAHE